MKSLKQRLISILLVHSLNLVRTPFYRKISHYNSYIIINQPYLLSNQNINKHFTGFLELRFEVFFM